MSSRYNPNRWELYDPNRPNEEQPHSFITKRKLEIMEKGIEDANITLEIGEVRMGTDYGVTITEDPINKTKKLNIVFPPAGQGPKGQDGKSAYQSWLDLGNVGTEQEFLDYLKGKDGKDGKDGRDGRDGDPGPAGESAYQSWLALGNTGSINDFLNSLKGTDGKDGKDGIDGINGKDGVNGVDGKSAYQSWLDTGNTGSEIEFVNSLKGKDGIDGQSAYEIWKSIPGNENKTVTEFLESLKGESGGASEFVEF